MGIVQIFKLFHFRVFVLFLSLHWFSFKKLTSLAIIQGIFEIYFMSLFSTFKVVIDFSSAIGFFHWICKFWIGQNRNFIRSAGTDYFQVQKTQKSITYYNAEDYICPIYLSIIIERIIQSGSTVIPHNRSLIFTVLYTCTSAHAILLLQYAYVKGELASSEGGIGGYDVHDRWIGRLKNWPRGELVGIRVHIQFTTKKL